MGKLFNDCLLKINFFKVTVWVFKTNRVCHVWCNFSPSYTYRSTVIFITLKDGVKTVLLHVRIPKMYSFTHLLYSLNVNEWKFHSPKEWNSCKPLKQEWFCTLNSKFPLIKSENRSKKSELPLIWGVKRRTTRKRIVLRLTPQTSGNSLFLESFSLYMSGNLLFNVQNHSFLSGLQEFHSFGEWNFHSFTFREYLVVKLLKVKGQRSFAIWTGRENAKILRLGWDISQIARIDTRIQKKILWYTSDACILTNDLETVIHVKFAFQCTLRVIGQHMSIWGIANYSFYFKDNFIWHSIF